MAGDRTPIMSNMVAYLDGDPGAHQEASQAVFGTRIRNQEEGSEAEREGSEAEREICVKRIE